MIIKNKMKSRSRIAITEIILLVVSIIAISWIVGSSIEVVSASGNCWDGDENYCVNPNVPCENGYTKSDLDCGTLEGVNQVCCEPTKTEDDSKKLDLNLKQFIPYAPAATKFGKDTIKDIKAAKEVSDIVGIDPGNELGDLARKKAEEEAAKKMAGNTVKKSGWLSSLLGGTLGDKTVAGETVSSFGGTFATAVVWSGIAFLAGRYVLGPWIGLSVQNSQALGLSLAGGTGLGILLGGTKLAESLTLFGFIPGGVIIGLAVAAIMFIALAKKSSVDVIQNNCYQWDSQIGGENCELCNRNSGLPCTEYQCASLGQGCALNEGICEWANPRDTDYPVIKPWQDALLDDLEYSNNNAISPPDAGVYLEYKGAQKTSTGKGGNVCIPAFAPVTLGVELNEPAKCKISPIRTPSYEETADYFMNYGIRGYNHSYSFSLPSAAYLESENITLDPGNDFEMYVRCMDGNGNSNPANFVFEFCIDDSPDTTAPEIVTTSIFDGHPIGYGQKNSSLDLFLRDSTFLTESSSCKWSRLDKSYENMEENMTCLHKIIESNAQLLYQCSTTLTGIKDLTNNKFYFRCIDDLGNANTESYLLNLVGTQPLVIDWVKPEGVIEDSTSPIKITLEAHTSVGYSEGLSTCSFSTTGESDDYVQFANTINYEHSQELWLLEGDYDFFIKCVDLGGNTDNATATFSVEVDLDAPIIVRAFKEENDLKVITDEESECVYSNFDCTYEFEDGTPMTTFDEVNHLADWDIDSDLYIKCKDDYENRPLPNECSLIVRPFEIFELQ